VAVDIWSFQRKVKGTDLPYKSRDFVSAPKPCLCRNEEWIGKRKAIVEGSHGKIDKALGVARVIGLGSTGCVYDIPVA
jgi:hypothetical protein